MYDSARENFIKAHNTYLAEWDRAMQDGDASEIEKLMRADYYVTFFMQNQDKPAFFEREEAIEGMRQSVSAHGGEKKRFENRVISLRDGENAVVFYEQILEKDDKELARLFTIENWKFGNGQWELVREVEEQIN